MVYLFNRGDELYANNPAGLTSNSRISFHICQKIIAFSELNDSNKPSVFKNHGVFKCNGSDLFPGRVVAALVHAYHCKHVTMQVEGVVCVVGHSCSM